MNSYSVQGLNADEMAQRHQADMLESAYPPYREMGVGLENHPTDNASFRPTSRSGDTVELKLAHRQTLSLDP